MTHHKDNLHLKLEAARRDLLDLSARNTLLNYRTLKSRGLEIVDAIPAEVYRLLVTEKKLLSFSSAQNNFQENLLFPPVEEHQELPTVHPKEIKLQTPYLANGLQSRLLATYYASRTFIEEQGVNILFLALGMLNWYEIENSQVCRRAPLLLIPVELTRTNALEKFRIHCTEEEIKINISLQAKLEAEFGIKLPSISENEETEVDSYFDAIAKAVKGQANWSIDRNAVVLGFFSFEKLLMYHDLDVSAWPSESAPTDHPIIKALLQDGFREEPSQFTENEHLDKRLAPDALHLVMDADSSQTLAMLDVKQGRNLVIQGPLGTGKSQTITNLISEAIGNGKTVLFVAEKMAALKVVKRRLDNIGLGDACLELHSHKANKKAVLKELERTLRLGEPQLKKLESEIKILGQMRDRLNSYCEAINTPIGESGVTLYQAVGELSRIRQYYAYDAFPKLRIDSMQSWHGEDFKKRQVLVEELQSRLDTMGVPKEHPFWGSRLVVLLPTEQNRIRNLLICAKNAIISLRAATKKLADILHIQAPNTRKEAEYLCEVGLIALEAPDLQGVNIRAKEWEARHHDISNLLSAGAKINEIYNSHCSILIPEAWKQNLKEIRASLISYGDKWWRILSRDYRRADEHLRRLCQNKSAMTINQKLALVDAVIEAQRQTTIFRAHEALGKLLFDKRWQRGDSDWRLLTGLSNWLFPLHQEINTRNLPPEILNFLASNYSRVDLKQNLNDVQKASLNQTESIHLVLEALKFDQKKRFVDSPVLEKQSFINVEELIATWLERLNELHTLVAYNHLEETCRREHLESVITVAESWPEARHQILAAFQYAWFEALFERAYMERETLHGFSGDSHEHVIKKFRELDVLFLEYNRRKLAYSHWQRAPKHGSNGQLGILQREFQRKARHLPIRQLMIKAGNAIQGLKPVFMMSPLSIATYLPPEGIKFDVIIFDEASQVIPVEAFGAILRGKQVIVVGDSQQLPPTNFFKSLTQGDDESEDNVTSDLESILGLFLAQGSPERMLRWHYRSRHESLIAVSNNLFYNNRLTIFPSPDADRKDVGLHYYYLSNTSYDRGKSHINQGEAEIVAQAVMQHARTHPNLTLGVVAFSVAQMQAIQDQLELQRKKEPSCEDFFCADSYEPFFVKNLENVQGDERDVIFISIGYGHDKDGYISMAFGPLNNKGGERRLNVLITRARKRCEVFTNLTSDDIDLDRSKALGVKALKVFLEYAQHGKLEVAASTGREADSPFEIAVAMALQNLGYSVKQQVGSAGFFIDLAVVDLDCPGRYLLGIECDGATYHSARSARDRDRLRQQVLEGLGWRIHRIWSTDWFNNPDRELKRVVDAIERAKEYSSAEKESSKSISATTVIKRSDRQAQTLNIPAIPEYELATFQVETNGTALHELPINQLASFVSKVVQIESPVHISEVAKRITSAAGVARLGNRIQAAIENACKLAVTKRVVQRKGEFLWDGEIKVVTPRDRSKLDTTSRNIDLIAPEEIVSAVQKVVSDSFGIEPEKIPQAVCRLFGFMRVTEDMSKQVESIVNWMLKEKQLVCEGNHVITHQK